MSDARDVIDRLRGLVDQTAPLRHAETCDRAYPGQRVCTCGLDAADEILVALPALLAVAEAALKTVEDCESTAECMRSEIDRGIALRQSFESKQARIDVSEGAARTLRPALDALAKVTP